MSKSLGFCFFFAFFLLLISAHSINQNGLVKDQVITPSSGIKSACYHLFSRFRSINGVGYVQKLGGLNTYISGSLNSKKGVILVTDIYGYEAPNLRKLADKVAAAGFYVVAPDFLHGDPWVDNGPSTYADWIARHGADKATKEAIPIIKALKAKGISYVAVVGFCWGGKVTVPLAQYDDLVKTIVLLHPAMVTVEDIQRVRVPISILGGQLDAISPPALINKFKEILSFKLEVPSAVEIFPGVAHGFSLRYDVHDKAAVKSANEAHNDMIAWLKKYITWDYLLSVVPQ